MLRRSNTFWGQAADLAAVLVQERGLPWRMAHQTVGIMVRLAEEEGIGPSDATPALLDRAATLFLGRPVGLSAAQLAAGLDAAACVQTRTATGSPGPAEMRRQIAASRQDSRGRPRRDPAPPPASRGRRATPGGSGGRGIGPRRR